MNSFVRHYSFKFCSHTAKQWQMLVCLIWDPDGLPIFLDPVYIGFTDRKPPWTCPADKGVIYHHLSWSIKTFIQVATESAACNKVEHEENENTTSRMLRSVESLWQCLDIEASIAKRPGKPLMERGEAHRLRGRSDNRKEKPQSESTFFSNQMWVFPTPCEQIMCTGENSADIVRLNIEIFQLCQQRYCFTLV